MKMALDGKIITHKETNQYLDLGFMCYAMRCLPTDLRKQDYVEVQYLAVFFREMQRKNPLNGLFG